jgi:hypothetical protein
VKTRFVGPHIRWPCPTTIREPLPVLSAQQTLCPAQSLAETLCKHGVSRRSAAWSLRIVLTGALDVTSYAVSAACNHGYFVFDTSGTFCGARLFTLEVRLDCERDVPLLALVCIKCAELSHTACSDELETRHGDVRDASLLLVVELACIAQCRRARQTEALTCQ